MGNLINKLYHSLVYLSLKLETIQVYCHYVAKNCTIRSQLITRVNLISSNHWCRNVLWIGFNLKPLKGIFIFTWNGFYFLNSITHSALFSLLLSNRFFFLSLSLVLSSHISFFFFTFRGDIYMFVAVALDKMKCN